MDVDFLKAYQELARRDFNSFVKYTKPDYRVNWHHNVLMDACDKFAKKEIKKLMVFMPPQHGKSEIVSRRLPSYLLGVNPKNRIIGCSYSSDLSSAFNRDVQRIIDDEKYFSVFPETQLNSKNVVSDSKGGYLRNADIFEVVNHRGFYKSIGVGGSLTGTPADIGIIDDPIKDSVAAQSAIFRARAWEWYNDVFLTRMHNDSQIILCMTRWDEDDLAGRILATEKEWHIVKFEAIAEAPNELDPRKIGEPLWGEQHSLERLEEVRNKSPRTFHALYQQDPRPFEGGLVYDQFTIIDNYDKIEGKFKGYGLDFGFSNDPSALMEIKVIGEDCYISEKLYKNRLTTGDLIGHLHGIIQDKSRIEADSSRPDSIEEMSRAGFNVHPCVKGAGSIEERIDIVKRYNLFVDKNSLNLIRELKRYKWMEDKDGNAVRKPVDFMNHLMDCFYILQWYHKNVVVQPLRTINRMVERKPIRKDFR